MDGGSGGGMDTCMRRAAASPSGHTELAHLAPDVLCLCSLQCMHGGLGLQTLAALPNGGQADGVHPSLGGCLCVWEGGEGEDKTCGV